MRSQGYFRMQIGFNGECTEDTNYDNSEDNKSGDDLLHFLFYQGGGGNFARGDESSTFSTMPPADDQGASCIYGPPRFGKREIEWDKEVSCGHICKRLQGKAFT